MAGVIPPPLLPHQVPGLGHRLAKGTVLTAMRVTLVFSPRPTVRLLRKLFASGGQQIARRLAPHVPAGIDSRIDEQYGTGRDERLDVYTPAGPREPLPTVVWIHGGAWIGGSKEELAGWFKLIAGGGYTVVAPKYSLAPSGRYPTPLRQMMQALRHVQENAERLQVDPTRIVVAGDSAGAQLAAQIGAVVTTPGYADAVGVGPTLPAANLRGLVLACGPYDLDLLLNSARSDVGQKLVDAVMWAYCGRRRYARDPLFATMTVADRVTPSFPPTLITVGNDDPLRAHSELLVTRLEANGCDTETVFFPADYAPPLGHEYQFDLDTEAGRLFLERLRAFLTRVG